jgi:hypothetical protein
MAIPMIGVRLGRTPGANHAHRRTSPSDSPVKHASCAPGSRVIRRRCRMMGEGNGPSPHVDVDRCVRPSRMTHGPSGVIASRFIHDSRAMKRHRCIHLASSLTYVASSMHLSRSFVHASALLAYPSHGMGAPMSLVDAPMRQRGAPISLAGAPASETRARMSVMDAPIPWDGCTNEPRGCADEGREVHAYRLLVQQRARLARV